MPGQVIGKSLLRGFFGNVARSIDTIIEASQNKEASAAIAFGSAKCMGMLNMSQAAMTSTGRMRFPPSEST